MSNLLTITVEGERISLTAEDGSLLSRTSSLIAVDKAGQRMDFGKSLEELRNQPAVRILNPLSVETFHPNFAAAIIRRLVVAAETLLSDPHAEKPMKPMAYQMHIPGYDSLGKDIQESFEYHVQRMLRKTMQRLEINGKLKDIAVFRQTERAILVGLTLTPLLILGVIITILNMTMPEQMTKPLTGLEILLRLAAYLGIFYVSVWLYFEACKVSLKNHIPAPLYKDMIEATDLSPRRLLSLLQDRISSSQKGD